VLTVGVDAAVVERRLVAGELACPGCAGVLAGWGHARSRVIRGESGRWQVRPRRARCGGCGATHVLLPLGVLLRRADAVGVVGAAIAAKAAGAGARPIAGLLGRPLGTVREWLRRFGGRVEAVRGWFTGLLCAVAVDPVPPEPAWSGWADAVAAMQATAVAVAARFAVTGVTVWQVVGAASSGLLLAPGWPAGSINTSSPWAALA
jgi:transposase-like protein